jgi:hypothetical protein
VRFLALKASFGLRKDRSKSSGAIRWCDARPGLHPVGQRQTLNPAEMLLIIGYQSKVAAQETGGNGAVADLLS